MNRVTAVFERDGGWWIGNPEELSDAKAVALIIEANRELAQKICKDLNIPLPYLYAATIDQVISIAP